jgi:hypothetical protein
MIGKTLDIVVTSVLQTTAGKMIFGRFIDAGLPAPVGQPFAAERDKPEREKDDIGRARVRQPPPVQQT